MFIHVSLRGNGSVNMFPWQRIHEKTISGRVVFYEVCVVWNKCPWVCLCTPLSLLGNSSVNAFPRQKKMCWRRRFLCVQWRNEELAYFPKVGSCDLLPVCVSRCPCVCVYRCYRRGLLFDERKVRPFSVGPWLSKAATPPPPFQGCNIAPFEHLPNTLGKTEERTLNAIPKGQRKRSLIGSSVKHVSAFARQRPLYFCICVVKSKCFLAYFPYFEKIKLFLWDFLAVCLCVYAPLPLIGNGSINKFSRQRIHS
jgi:hypothetical protein